MSSRRGIATLGMLAALCIATTTAGAATAVPHASSVPVLDGMWAVTGTNVSNSDPVFNSSVVVGATLQRTWKFVQSCDAATCVTDLTRSLRQGERSTRIDYQGNNEFAWQDTFAVGQGACGPTSLESGTVQVAFTMRVKTVPIPTGRPVATSLTARGDFVWNLNQADWAALGCSVPAQVTYATTYAADSPNPPPSGSQVYGGPAQGYAPGQVKLPGSTSFNAITPGQKIPPGTVFDVSKGAGVTLADPKGRKSVFYGEKDGVPSVFVYAGVIGGFVELRLTGGNFASCKKSALRALAKAEKPVRRLWGKGKGKFRTRGRYASAAIRGTWWLTADYCTRTMISVKEGTVTVRDLVKKKTVIVRAGKSYSAER